MKIFDISPLMETIQQDLEEGREPDPAVVALLCQEGPKAIEEWTDAIANVEAEAEAIKARIVELKARKEAREQTVERMEGALKDVLKRHFNGKVKTPLLTTWVQKTTIYNVSGADPVKNPQFFKIPEPELKKSEVIRVYKEWVLPGNITVTEDSTESVRVRRS